jgi:potassium-transporting ATPase KdpC subunit
MKEAIRPAIVALLAFTVLCGFVYPLVIDGIAAVAFPRQATGSLIRDHDGKIVGSELIGQPFDNPAYFWSRLTAQASYDASSSLGTNLGQSGFIDDRGRLGPNPTLAGYAQARIDALRAADPGNTAQVPVDLVTSSGSGLDPHLSPAAALYQIGRVARARGQPPGAIREIVERHIEPRTLGVLGEPRVNVVRLNRALDDRFGPATPNG